MASQCSLDILGYISQPQESLDTTFSQPEGNRCLVTTQVGHFIVVLTIWDTVHNHRGTGGYIVQVLSTFSQSHGNMWLDIAVFHNPRVA